MRRITRWLWIALITLVLWIIQEGLRRAGGERREPLPPSPSPMKGGGAAKSPLPEGERAPARGRGEGAPSLTKPHGERQLADPHPSPLPEGEGVLSARGEGVAHLPGPSVWPAVLGVGLTLLLFGLVTSLAFSAAGALLIAGALNGWIRELLHE